MKKKVTAMVVSQTMLTDGIYDLWLKTELSTDAAAGQFVGVFPRNAATLLPRPISICEVDKEQGAIRLVYRIAGKGTAEFATLEKGEQVSLLGVLGNGFPVAKAAGKSVVLLGGGIGIPPMLQLAKEIKLLGTEPVVIAGYRDQQLFLARDFEKTSMFVTATEDGSIGYQGNVLDALKELSIQPDLLMACGPMPMLRAVKAYAAEHQLPAYISLEERMACGVGACLGCVCTTVQKDEHAQVNHARICTEGPVFEAKEVQI